VLIQCDVSKCPTATTRSRAAATAVCWALGMLGVRATCASSQGHILHQLSNVVKPLLAGRCRPCTRASPAAFAAPRHAPCLPRWSGRPAGSCPSTWATRSRRALSACSTPPSGTRRRCATTRARRPLGRSTRPMACSSSTTPASSRRTPSRSACSGRYRLPLVDVAELLAQRGVQGRPVDRPRLGRQVRDPG
jgi:hypothetical protein